MNPAFRLRFVRSKMGHAVQSLYTRAESLEEATRKGHAVVRERLHPTEFEVNTGLESEVRFYQAEGPIEDKDIPPHVSWI